MVVALVVGGLVLFAGLLVFVVYATAANVAERRRAFREYATEMGFLLVFEYEFWRGGPRILIQGDVGGLRFLAHSWLEPGPREYYPTPDGGQFERTYSRMSTILWERPRVPGWSFKEQGASDDFEGVQAVDSFIRTTGRHARSDFAAWRRGEPQDVSSSGGQRVGTAARRQRDVTVRDRGEAAVPVPRWVVGPLLVLTIVGFGVIYGSDDGRSPQREPSASGAHVEASPPAFWSVAWAGMCSPAWHDCLMIVDVLGRRYSVQVSMACWEQAQEDRRLPVSIERSDGSIERCRPEELPW